MEKKMTGHSWSDLPQELLSSIGKRLETDMDILHFRAVCHPWRSSISLPPKSPPLSHPLGSFLIYQTTIYRLEPDLETLKTSPNNSWLIKVQEPKDGGKVRALDPFSALPIKNLPDSFPRVLSLLNLHVSEISRAFKLQKTRNAYDDVEDDEARVYKVELSPNFELNKAVIAIKGGDLCCMIAGYEKYWVLVDNDAAYRDVVNYQGNFYAVDRFGNTTVLEDASLVITQFVLPPKRDERFNGDWYFIKSCRDLFLVCRDLSTCADKVYYDEDMDAFVKECNDFDIPVDFKVYTLKDDLWYKWREVNNLGDRAFFVSYHCSFSVLARDFAGCKANCIYFVDEILNKDGEGDNNELKGLDDRKIYVFNLEDGSSGPLTSYPGCSNIFWPPPAWLRSNPSSSSC